MEMRSSAGGVGNRGAAGSDLLFRRFHIGRLSCTIAFHNSGESIQVRGYELAHTAMLFDLAEDPGERYNLYDDPGYSSVRHELMMELLDHYHLAKDPLPLRLSGA